jgi:hypothetical protein
MDPMARKLGAEIEAFQKAIEQQDGAAAQVHINEIQKFAAYLSDDIHSIVQKLDKAVGPNDLFAGGVPVMRFNETQNVFDVSKRDSVLPGMILPARTGNIMRPQQRRL